MIKRIVVTGGALAALAAALVLVRPGPSTPLSAQQDTVAAYEAPVDVDTTRLPGPRQPIFYRHDIHAGQYQMDCRYCHYAVEISRSPGLPTLSTCMGCHLVAGRGNPEVEKLAAAYGEGRPVEWVEIHRLPPFVQFPHHRHVNADVTCQDCHGPIDRMPQVYQFASLKMGWCLDCHAKEDVSTDCTTCHY